MTPAQFIARLKKGDFAPAYLFLGTESYERRRCREMLIGAVAGDDRQNAVTHYDMSGSSLAEVVDDARSLSLFASQRVIFCAKAEAPLPHTDAASGEAKEDPLAAYLKDPSPGVVLVFDCDRYEFEGEDKKKMERVRKFYSAVLAAVEMKPYSSDEARMEAGRLAQRAELTIEPAALELLVESLGNDISRIAVEIEKLALFAGPGRPVGVDDIAALVPDARVTTIFALVNALGRRDRARSLAVLDTLTKEGEYLPMALSFLSGQFRLALISKEAGLRSSSQIQQHFTRIGVPMWGARAEQVYQTTAKFSKEQLTRALKLIFAADKGLRDARPDDRIVMEQFVLELTA
jgi:DNA polymerase III subunit delta